MTQQQEKQLIKSQQGELDAVLMYRALAAAVTDPAEAAAFRRLAEDEARHAKVFQALTQSVLIPKKKLALLVPLLYRTLGKEKVYPMIAKGEYDAVKNYEPLAAAFPSVAAVQADEQHHGDAVTAMLK